MRESTSKTGSTGDPQRLSASDGQRTIFYVVDWLPPHFGAVGQYAAIFSRDMAEEGRQVVLIGLTTGNSEVHRELFPNGGVLEINRLRARKYNKTGIVGRLIWSLQTDLRLIFSVVRDHRSKNSDILFTGSPPFMLYFVFLGKLFRRARLIYRITDFYPEVIFATLGYTPIFLAFIEKITWFLRKRIDSFQVLGEDQRLLLHAGGIAPHKITLKRDMSPIPISKNDTPARHPAELTGHKILLYSGNYGVAHEVNTVVSGLIQHHRYGSGRFALWLNSSGSAVQSIVAALLQAGIPFAHSEPSPLDQLPALLAAADAHLISLRSAFSGYVIPSKIYGCLQSGRPILFVGPKSSDVHLLSTEDSRSHYEHVEPGDVPGFADALERLAQLPSV